MTNFMIHKRSHITSETQGQGVFYTLNGDGWMEG
jgi:hypothetical protein